MGSAKTARRRFMAFQFLSPGGMVGPPGRAGGGTALRREQYVNRFSGGPAYTGGRAPRLRIVIARDSFKGSLRAPAVADEMAAGARRALPRADLDLCPVGDGGEGTLDALLIAMGGDVEQHVVAG